jgi:REP element-mobilizing transposase RayT
VSFGSGGLHRRQEASVAPRLSSGNYTPAAVLGQQRQLSRKLLPEGIHLMADTHHMLLYHFVFSTKNRRRWIEPAVAPNMFEYLGGCIRGLGGVALKVGGWLDHVHLLVKLRTTHCVADVLRELKSNSSRHFNESTRSLEKFGWQDGYGAFTVSGFRKEQVIQYIGSQREHHEQEDSRTEYLRMLQIHGVEFDPRFVDD